MKLKVTVNGIAYDVNVEVEEEPAPTLGAIMIGSTSAYGVTPTAAKATADARNGLTAPLAGTVVKIMVSEGDAVKAGQTLMLLEAMKMETEITAPAAGKVVAVLVKPGDAVQGGQALIEL
ncbi:MAG: biotin/lipoyl-binding protein [Tetrasphaera sp.]|nr:biotin/lipoyl-binding protein [Tetrasphaera sp.]